MHYERSSLSQSVQLACLAFLFLFSMGERASLPAAEPAIVSDATSPAAASLASSGPGPCWAGISNIVDRISGNRALFTQITFVAMCLALWFIWWRR
jgi:hypothetical protein